MILGEYPCCEGFLCLTMPDDTPAYAPEDCPHCGVRVWHVFSRVEPMTYLEPDFLARYQIDSEAKMIVRREETETAG